MAGIAIIASDQTNGAPNVARVAALATTNANSIKQTAGLVFAFAFNLKSAAALVRFVKFYDKASAPVVGTDTPMFTMPIVCSGNAQSPTTMEILMGIPFKNGIAYAITGGVADTDTTACAADDVHGFILWK
jgi:hypothetical protein